MKNHVFSLFTVLSIGALALSGCQNQQGKYGRAGTTGDGGNDSDTVTGSPLGTPLAERRDGVSFLSSNVDRSQFSPVYFGFDSFDIGAGERGKIERVAASLKNDPRQIIIAGFTDERGTAEYNRALGERRAQTVREALIEAGVRGSDVQTVSFGAEMPADSGSNESAWAKNRRAEFGVVK